MQHGNSTPVASYTQPSFHHSASTQSFAAANHVYPAQPTATMPEFKMHFGGDFNAQGGKASFQPRRAHLQHQQNMQFGQGREDPNMRRRQP